MLLEIKGLTSIADYFVICSGESATQIKAIAEHIKETLKKIGLKPRGVEGLGFARWVLMDYGDFIIHIFDEETRAYYELEKFWIDAPRLIITDETIKKLSSKRRSDAL